MDTWRPSLTPGDPAPAFAARGPHDPYFPFGHVAGAYAVLCFFGSAAKPDIRAMLDQARAHPLPFLYDEVAAKLREENLKYLRTAERNELPR